MKHLYLMRHAEAEKDPDQAPGHLFSTGDRRLSATGREEAQAMAELLDEEPVEAVIASPAKRCQETARTVAEPHGLAVNTDKRLWEVPYGTPERSYEEVLSTIVDTARTLREADDVTLPGGESFQAETARYREALQDALAGHDRVLIVGHGAQNRAYLTHLLGMPTWRMFHLEQDHGCLNLVAHEGNRSSLLKLNVTAAPLASATAGL